MWEFWFHTIFFKKEGPTEKSWLCFIFIFDIRETLYLLFFGTIFTITIKFVQLMIDQLFLRFDPLSPSSWRSGLYFNFQADFG